MTFFFEELSLRLKLGLATTRDLLLFKIFVLFKETNSRPVVINRNKNSSPSNLFSLALLTAANGTLFNSESGEINKTFLF